MIPSRSCLGVCRSGATNRLAVRLLRDEVAAMSFQYVVAAVVIALAALAASRPIAGVLSSLLYRVHIIVTMPIP
jgi:hypothetical protein